MCTRTVYYYKSFLRYRFSFAVQVRMCKSLFADFLIVGVITQLDFLSIHFRDANFVKNCFREDDNKCPPGGFDLPIAINNLLCEGVNTIII